MFNIKSIHYFDLPNNDSIILFLYAFIYSKKGFALPVKIHVKGEQNA